MYRILNDNAPFVSHYVTTTQHLQRIIYDYELWHVDLAMLRAGHVEQVHFELALRQADRVGGDHSFTKTLSTKPNGRFTIGLDSKYSNMLQSSATWHMFRPR